MSTRMSTRDDNPTMSRHNLRSSAPGPGQHQTPGHVEGQPSLIWYTFLYLPDEVPQHTY